MHKICCKVTVTQFHGSKTNKYNIEQIAWRIFPLWSILLRIFIFTTTEIVRPSLRVRAVGESLLHFVYFNNICLSLSDEGNEVKSLHIERAEQFQLSLKI